eukprot:gene28426-31568_t
MCLDIDGYSSEINVDHNGDDISCFSGSQTLISLAAEFQQDHTCTSFSLFGDNLEDGCIKHESGPTHPVDGPSCYYTSVFTDVCTPVPGYTLHLHAALMGHDIACWDDGDDAREADMFSVVELSQTCDSNPDCKAFTVWGSSSHSSISYVQGCLKDSATVEMGNSGCILFGDNLEDGCIKNMSGPTRPVDGPTCYYTSLCEYEAL